MAAPIPDLVNRNFQPDEPDVVWYGDITYIWINNKFWYLATVIDAATKQVLGWRFDDNMETQLVDQALKSAAARRSKSCRGTIFHTDRLNLGNTPRKISGKRVKRSVFVNRWAGEVSAKIMPQLNRSSLRSNEN